MKKSFDLFYNFSWRWRFDTKTSSAHRPEGIGILAGITFWTIIVVQTTEFWLAYQGLACLCPPMWRSEGRRVHLSCFQKSKPVEFCESKRVPSSIFCCCLKQVVSVSRRIVVTQLHFSLSRINRSTRWSRYCTVLFLWQLFAVWFKVLPQKVVSMLRTPSSRWWISLTTTTRKSSTGGELHPEFVTASIHRILRS